jgi:hypothetical protein
MFGGRWPFVWDIMRSLLAILRMTVLRRNVAQELVIVAISTWPMNGFNPLPNSI